MAYYSFGEFEVKFDDLLMQVGRLCDERSRDGELAIARRSLTVAGDRFKRGEKIEEKERVAVANALEKVRRVMHGDERYQEQIADIEDYVDSSLVVR